MSRCLRMAGLALIGLCLLSASFAAAQTAKPAAPAVKPAAQAAQPARPAEAKAEVPALDAMHETIMPMWHDAWPNKDYKALSGMLPDIEKHIAAISEAELPGILREKAPQWAVGLADLKKAGAGYKAAVASGKNEDLLKAAEALHTQYEKLVRIIKPVLPELDDFHGTLYVLYHTQTNPLVVAKVAASVETLKVKMAALDKATLPDRLKAKAAEFTAQRDRLAKSLTALSSTLAGGDEAKIREAIELMHVEYQKLEKVFE
ncbi:MAG: hypothetical protein NT151_13145 [Acidobacteria bacterium]|nr:hypothetical protein [Acidobacteriota bacterium]